MIHNLLGFMKARNPWLIGKIIYSAKGYEKLFDSLWNNLLQIMLYDSIVYLLDGFSLGG